MQSTPWRRALVGGLAVWAVTHLGYVLVSACTWTLTREPAPLARTLLSTWVRWDAGHYLHIAQYGYADEGGYLAFFPLYPMLIAGFDAVLPGGGVVAALVVANLAGLAALVLLYRLTAHELDDETADRTIFYLAAFPTGFFLAVAYNESLFIALAVAALYAARRGHWWLAGLAGAGASATRMSGVLLLAPLAYEYVRQNRRIQLDAAALALVPLGLVGFAAYLWQHHGDPLAFSHAQAHYGRAIAPPWTVLSDTVVALDNRKLLDWLTVHNAKDLAALAFVVALLVLAVVGPWRLRRDQFFLVVYGGTNLVPVLLTEAHGWFPMQGAARYALEVVPAFIVLARMGANRHVGRLYLVPALMLQAVFLVIYVDGGWVA